MRSLLSLRAGEWSQSDRHMFHNRQSTVSGPRYCRGQLLLSAVAINVVALSLGLIAAETASEQSTGNSKLVSPAMSQKHANADLVQKNPPKLGGVEGANASNPKMHDALGVALADKGRLDAAIDEFQAAAKGDDQWAPPHYHLGLAYFRTGRTSDAVEEYQRALWIDSDLPESRYGLSMACWRLGDLDGAIEQLEWITRRSPRFAEA